MSDYVYKDNEAAMPTLSAMLTSRIGDESGDHEQAYLDTIYLLASAFGEGAMIDIGCGRGRLAEGAANSIAEIVALEPDPGRCKWSQDILAERQNISVHQQTTSEYMSANPGKQFDLTVLGMVVQHLATTYAREVMEDVARLTRPGGMAVVSTTHALEKARCFTYQHIAEARISEEEFNAYASNTAGQDKGLPVHRFSREEFLALQPSSMEVVHWEQFSYYRPEFLQHFADLHKVEPQELANHGNSQFMVLKKRA